MTARLTNSNDFILIGAKRDGKRLILSVSMIAKEAEHCVPNCGRHPCLPQVVALERIFPYFDDGICDFPPQADGIYRGKTG